MQNLWTYFISIEAEILIICAQVELTGICLNINELEAIKTKLVKQRKEIESRINKIAGYEVNLNSTDQVASLIYDKLKLQLPSVETSSLLRINSGAGTSRFKHHSTSKEVLNQLASQHQVPKLIVLWRKISHTLANSIYPVERVCLCEYFEYHNLIALNQSLFFVLV